MTSNQIVFLSLDFDGDSTHTGTINCNFLVKRLRTVSVAFQSTGGLVNVGYVTSTIPNTTFLCYTDGISSTKTFEYVFGNPIPINGSFTFTARNLLGVATNQTAGCVIGLVLELVSE